MSAVHIIAEAGVNHNGDMTLAKDLVIKAKEAGADAIKFQTFQADKLVTKDAEQARYQTENMKEKKTQYYMLKQLELSKAEFREIKSYCDEKDIEFMATPFDEESADFLINELNVRTIKISSGDLTNLPLLYHIAKRQMPLILSTGMADTTEIHEALATLSQGYSREDVETFDTVWDRYNLSDNLQLLKKKVTLLHCTTSYPTPASFINLQAINFLKDTFQLSTGFSDHSEGIFSSVAAVSHGTEVIEKHFTLDKSLPGPDHKASLEPDEFRQMVDGIRFIEQAEGEYGKDLVSIEKENIGAARKSLYLTSTIQEGEIFQKKHIGVKRPGNGTSPKFYWDWIGRVATRNYVEGEEL